MTLQNEELQHLLDFVGYGELSAPVWFLGMEEAGGVLHHAQAERPASRL
jgi:hypothetical protein